MSAVVRGRVTIKSRVRFGARTYASGAIGDPGQQGFGVGICPAPPAGMTPMSGYADVASANYGNYGWTDGSVMVWIPAFYYKWGTGANGLALNAVSVVPYTTYATSADAAAAGYALHRAFWDGGVEQPGVFVDKFQCSKNGGVASSIALGNPLSSATAHNPFGGLTGAPTNSYYGAIAAAKTRGANFFCTSRFIYSALAMLSYAHASAASATTWCAWYDAAGVINFPKGNNNDALRDKNDTSVLYLTDGYSNCGKTGSGDPFAKTTHNGQNCGVADLNGNMWEISPGLTSNGSLHYAIKTSVAMKSVTGGNTLGTDLWGANGIAALYQSLGATFGALQSNSTAKYFGNAGAQVLNESTSGDGWITTGLAVPKSGGTGGSNLFGNDLLYDSRPNDMCPLSGGNWNSGAGAGVWALYLGTRGASDSHIGFRSALYL